MSINGVFLCPVFDEICPYCKKGMCYMAKMGEGNPIEEYDAWADEEEEE